MSYGANDPHGTPPATGWDYAITFPTPPPPQKHALLACLRDKGFHYSQHVTNKFIFVRLALPETVMMEKAELLGKELKLRQNYGGGYLPFSRDRAHVFENERRLHGGYFSPADRVLITLAVLRSREGWGADIDLGRLKKAGVIQQAFALHSDEREDLLHRAVFRQWWNPFRAPPVQLLKDYFGSRVTVYLAWLMFYARMLMGIACLSVPVYVTLNWSRSERIGDAVRLAFGLCICFWGAYWLEYWKRRNAVLNVKWGLSDFYEDQGNEIRPEFRGSDDTGFYSRGGFVHLADLQPGYRGDADNVRLRNVVEDGDMSGDTQQVVVIGGEGDADFTLEAPVTGLVFGDLPTFPYFSHSDLRNRMYMSAVVTAFFAICVGVCSFLILFYKRAIIGLFGGYIGGRGNVVPGIMTGLLISVSDPFWKKVSLKLATWENHRTNQSFENSLIWKRFAFQFVSNYISLFYIAFIKPFTPNDACILGKISGMPDCMHELESQLTSLVITKATIQQLLELGVPFIRLQVKHWLHTHQQAQATDAESHPLLEDEHTPEEEASITQCSMAPYTSTIADYGEVVIAHGYFAMFGIAFPLAAVINLLNNLVESRTDVYKMLTTHQRPDADDAADIGGWLHVLHFVSNASLITTAALVTITTPALQRVLPNFIGDAAEKYPAVSFLIFEHMLLGIRWAVGWVVSDVPASAYRMLARQQFLTARCFGVGWKAYFKSNDEKEERGW